MKTCFLISLFYVNFCVSCFADELYFFITRDSAHTNLVQTICGRPVSPEKFKNALIRIGEFARQDGWSVPVQITENVSIADLLSTVDTLQDAGISNYIFQVRSADGPTMMTNKRDLVLKIEDYSKEPVNELMKYILRTMRDEKKGAIRAKRMTESIKTTYQLTQMVCSFTGYVRSGILGTAYNETVFRLLDKSADDTEVVPPPSSRGLLWREGRGGLRPDRTKAFCFCPAPSTTMTFCALNPALA